jgi:phosphomannomutase
MMADRCKPACFKAYDIRGQVPGQLDGNLARRIGLAAARAVGTGRWAVGWDCRLSSPGLAAALAGGLAAGGADVVELGMCGTEQVYHAVFSLGLAGGIMELKKIVIAEQEAGSAGREAVDLIRVPAFPLATNLRYKLRRPV